LVTMTRHSKNCTASSVYSYNEKKKDAKASGYGSLKLLCLSPTVTNPVVTPDGHLFDKEAIFEYIISKKNEISQKIKEYEKQCKKDQRELAELGEAENRSRVENFLKTEAAVSSASQAAQGGPSTSAGKSGSSVSNMASGLDKKLPSFWIPSLTPGNKETKLQKPDKTVFCPISGKPLKIKDLIDVKFTLAVDPNDKGALDGKRERYKCPVTGDILRNNVPCAVLRPTGDVVTKECVEKLIKKDMLHPLTGAKFHWGGTGFTTANDQLMSKKARPVLQA
ncbi:Nitric oxide synthase-interacting protein-like, partial [Homarus americanus]